jgi:predicted nucleic acid-binding protein
MTLETPDTPSPRAPRRRGITPRKTIDMIIGTYCIVHGLRLLHADRDFDVLEKELGLLVLKP